MRHLDAQFHVGQIVQHRLFDYRGVIVDVDAGFEGTPAWYQNMAKSNPPKDRPWYHVLVDDADYQTYVAERNLEPATDFSPIKHPEIRVHFNGMDGDQYRLRVKQN